jgi:hypothetical protein
MEQHRPLLVRTFVLLAKPGITTMEHQYIVQNVLQIQCQALVRLYARNALPAKELILIPVCSVRTAKVGIIKMVVALLAQRVLQVRFRMAWVLLNALVAVHKVWAF